jgi:hypothetical protein
MGHRLEIYLRSSGSAGGDVAKSFKLTLRLSGVLKRVALKVNHRSEVGRDLPTEITFKYRNSRGETTELFCYFYAGSAKLLIMLSVSVCYVCV